MVLEEISNSSGLIRGHREDVAESTATEYDLLARALWVVHSGARVDLGGTDCSKESTCNRETGTEHRPIPRTTS